MVTKRKAIAMIELIIAIVIMGIAFLAIPMINNEAIKSGENAMLQESVAAGASQTELILTLKWDGASNDILDTNTSWDGLSGTTASREIDDDNKTASSIGHDDGDDFDDMDDYNGTSVTLDIYNDEDFDTYEGNYADQNITMATTVQYADDTAFNTQETMPNVNPFDYPITDSHTSNIKLITTKLTTTLNTGSDTIDKKEIKLQTFTCNIGKAKIQRSDSED